MEDRLSGSQGRVDRLLKTAERDTTASAHTNSQNRHTVLVSVIAIDKQSSKCAFSLCSQRPFTLLKPLVPMEQDGLQQHESTNSWAKSIVIESTLL